MKTVCVRTTTSPSDSHSQVDVGGTKGTRGCTFVRNFVLISTFVVVGTDFVVESMFFIKNFNFHFQNYIMKSEK